jgi:hypothetical protein
MPNFIKEHSLKLSAVLVCPVLAFLGTILVIAGQLLSIPVAARAGESLWSLSTFLALPVGLGCSFVSWRMAHRLAEAKRDTDDLIEFLLGFSGLLMIVLGGVVSPLWQWIADLS